MNAETTIITQLCASPEPSLRYALAVRVRDRAVPAAELARLQDAIQRSPRVRRLLSERAADGTIPRHPYATWDGAHWVLAALAALGYPPGDAGLQPLCEQVLSWLLSPHRARRIGTTVAGRARFCASQEGNAIDALLVLGLANARVERLVERLVRTQWPDGGWNCDRRPQAHTSSFHETWLPLRALVRYARLTGSAAARAAADRAAALFLSRSLFQRRRDGAVMRPSFVQLHYPASWHYDLLAGLTALAEGGYIHDGRCGAALDLLCAKQLADGGFPAEAAWYRLSDDKVPGRSLVPWGAVQAGTSNPWVTIEALSVLRAAGRLDALP